MGVEVSGLVGGCSLAGNSVSAVLAWLGMKGSCDEYNVVYDSVPSGEDKML